MAFVIGIDPGQKGGIALLNECDGRIIVVSPMPTVKVVVNGFERDRVSPDGIASLFEGWGSKRCVIRAHVEHVHAIAKKGKGGKDQGLASTATFLEGFGVLRGALAMAGIPVSLWDPRRWRGALGLRGGKDSSIQTAIKLEPGYADKFQVSDGMAEAFLIGFAGIRLERCK